jgi:prepilin-type N-terminal cleavage/methylation domain-containing protein
MPSRCATSRPAASCQGFSLIEVLVAVGIFLIVSVGTLSILGATAAGGLQDASPTALTAGRRAKDLTAAAIYLQGLHDYLGSLDAAAWDAVLGSWPPGAAGQTYCIQPEGQTCGGGDPVPPTALGPIPLPPSVSYQLPWVALRLVVQRWTWDCEAHRFSRAPSTATADLLVSIHSTLHWRVKSQLQTLSTSGGGLERFLPYRPSAITAEDVCL